MEITKSVAIDSPRRVNRFRQEIQGLRAIAVILVILFHYWPLLCPGGFVGVDVFFVISGFLMTRNLMRTYDENGKISAIQFWAHRARRLLPASLSVLLVVSLTTLAVVPRSLWQQFLTEIGAATLYTENLLLSINSQDYLASANARSPVQHFWSLSLEEQFYLALPLLIIFSLWLFSSRLRLSRRMLLALVLAMIGLFSFLWSLFRLPVDPVTTYYSLATRGWEFIVGGLIALLAPGPLRIGFKLATVLSAVGLALIGFSGFFYTSATPFPGVAALVPTIGTVLVLLVGIPRKRWTPISLLGIQPLKFIGDISYSLYLWHWPIFVLASYAGLVVTTDLSKLLLIGIAFLLGVTTKILVEDPVRNNVDLARGGSQRTFGLVAIAMSSVIIVSGLGWSVVQITYAKSLSLSDTESSRCLGAATMANLNNGCSLIIDPIRVVPDPSGAYMDRPEIYTDRCRSQPTDSTVKSCVFGKLGSAVKVALIGDSHAASWFPALQLIANQQGWELTTFFKASCAFSRSTRVVKGSPAISQSCENWNSKLSQRLSIGKQFNAVFTTYFVNDEYFETTNSAILGFRDAWRPLISRGTTIIALQDVPGFEENTQKCIEDNLDKLSRCSLIRKIATSRTDLAQEAAKGLPGAVRLDMTDLFCTSDSCPIVIGGVLVYRDGNHLTATYSRSLAPWLLKRIDSLHVVTR